MGMFVGDTIALTERALKKWDQESRSSSTRAVHRRILACLVWKLVQPNQSSSLTNSRCGAACERNFCNQDRHTGADLRRCLGLYHLPCPGVISLIIVFNQAFGGIDVVLDKQLGYLDTILAAPISRASISFQE